MKKINSQIVKNKQVLLRVDYNVDLDKKGKLLVIFAFELVCQQLIFY